MMERGREGIIETEYREEGETGRIERGERRAREGDPERGECPGSTQTESDLPGKGFEHMLSSQTVGLGGRACGRACSEGRATGGGRRESEQQLGVGPCRQRPRTVAAAGSKMAPGEGSPWRRGRASCEGVRAAREGERGTSSLQASGPTCERGLRACERDPGECERASPGSRT